MTCKQVAHVEQVWVAQDSFAMLSTAVMTVRCILRGLSWIFFSYQQPALLEDELR